MPKVQYAGRKSSVLALHAGMKETHREVGILKPPTDIAGIETIDAIEVMAGDPKVACFGTLPIVAATFAQRPERQAARRQQAIDAAA
jgi:hypothetical protein